MKKIFNIVVLMVCAISFSFAQSNVIIYASNDGSGNGQDVGTPTSLQGAIDTIKNAVVNSETTYEVQLLQGEYTGDNIGIGQQANKNVIIKPYDNGTCTMKGVFTIDGNGRSSNAESITFNNLTFDGGRITGGVVADGLGTDLAHSYPHNVNIENCKFKNSVIKPMIENPANCAAYNWKISGCDFTNCAYTIQTGGGGDNLQVLNCNFNNIQRGLNLNHSTNPLISNCTFTGVTKYAIRLGQGEPGTPDHTPAQAMHVNGCTISGEPVSGEEGLIVLRGDCKDMIIGNTTTVTATGSNPVAFFIKQDAKVYVDDAGTLILTGNVVNAGTIEGKSFTSHLTVSGTSNYKLPGEYCSVGTVWIGDDNWLYYGAQQSALSLNENGICEISTPAQLARLSCEVLTNTLPSFSGKRTFKIVNDIDLQQYIWFPIGTKDQSFSDNFDGANHIISNLHINQPDDSYLALIGRCQDNATIKNVVLNNVDITGYECVAGICGQTYTGTLFNNHVRGTVKITGSHFVGAISGHVYGNTYFCSVDGDNNSLIKGVTHLNESGYPVGGLVGYYAEGGYSMMNCSATVDVTANGRVGGLIGYLNANSKVIDCYHQGNVTYGDGSQEILSAKSGMGGIVGEALSGVQIINCYHTGNITNSSYAPGANAGFLVGKSSSPTVTNSYYDSGSTLSNGSSIFGEGKTATEMKTKVMAQTLGRAFIGSDGQYPELHPVLDGEGTKTNPYVVDTDDDLAFVDLMSHTSNDYLKSIFQNAYYGQTEDLSLEANDSITIVATMTYTVGSGKTLTVKGKVIDNDKLVGADATSQLTIAEGAVYGTKAAGTYVWFDPQWVNPNSSWLYIGAQQPALTYNGGVCEISSAEQLARLSYEAAQSTANYAEKTIKLTADIDLAGHEWCPIGIGDGYFDGVFDGQNHTISNMTITDDNPHLSYYDNALFGFLWFAEIKNLKLADVNVYITRAAAATVPNGAAAGGIAGTSVASYFENIEITSGEIHSEYGTCATGGINYLTTYDSYPTYLYNVVNRAKISGHICSPNASYFFLGGLVGHAANDLNYTAGDDDLIIFEKCANYGEIATANPYQLLTDAKFADGNQFAYTIAGQLVAQSDYAAKTYLVFDSCVAGGTLYGSPNLRNNAGTLTEIASGVFQGQKWTSATTSEPYGYTFDNNGSQNDYRIGNETVFFTDKNADEIYDAITNNGEFTTENHEYLSGSNKPANEAEKAAYAVTKAFISNATGYQKFIFRGVAIANNTFYTTVDSAAKVGLPGTIFLIASDTCANPTQWDANDTIQTIRNVKIVVPANATLTVNGTLELGNHAQCVGTDETSRIIVTRKCTGATETENINPGIYYWDASENTWGLVQEE